jgi:hypothetical protein
MMRKMAALAIAMTVVLVLPTMAAATGTHKSRPHVNGTITSWDDATKQATVKDSAGKEMSFRWNEKTQFTGRPQVGDHAFVSYTKDENGKVWAKYVSVGANPAWLSPH